MQALKAAVFRTDASSQIGAGHFMRCFTLAQKLASEGADIHFISRYLPDQFVEALLKKGYRFTHLPTSKTGYASELGHSHWLGVPQEIDVEQTLTALTGDVSLMVVDHYALDSFWEKSIRARTERIMVIDDVADREHDCDILLDQNLFKNAEERYKKLVPASCKTLLGPGYALLRNEFALLHRQAAVRSGEVNRILVLMGGVDKYNITSKVLTAIRRTGYDRAVDVIIGYQHPEAGMVGRQCKDYGYTLHRQPDNIAELMMNADISIGSSGSTSWERCCMGLPTICYTQAENQVPIAKGLEEEGVIVYGGDAIAAETAAIQLQLMQLIDAPHMISALSAKCMQLVDGLGVKKISRAIADLN